MTGEDEVRVSPDRKTVTLTIPYETYRQLEAIRRQGESVDELMKRLALAARVSGKLSA